MDRTLLTTCLLVFLAAVRVAAAPAPADRQGRRMEVVQAEPTVQDLIRDVLTGSPRETVAEGPVASDLAIPEGAKARASMSQSAQSLDKRTRKALVFLDPESKKPLCLVLFARQDDAKGRSIERLWLKFSVEGKLQKARRVPGPVERPGKTELLDPGSPKTAALGRRELDYWVKGVGAKR